jgi:hypothetical protein
MTRLLVMVCLVLVTAGTLCAEVEVPYTWTTESAGSGLDRLVLTVLPPTGVRLFAINIMVYDPLLRGLFVTGEDPIFKEGKDLDTSFLLNTQHGVFPNPTVDDLVFVTASESIHHLCSAFARTGIGAYGPGWSEPLDLLEILVPTGSTMAWSELVVTAVDRYHMPMGGPAMCWTNLGDGLLVPIPEPGTLALATLGLLGLATYSRQRRRMSAA